VIRASGITLRRGTKVLLDNTDFVAHPRERIGIVGENGAGKSSLFALLLGTLDLDGGNLSVPADWRIATVPQELEADPRPAREFVMDGDVQLRTLLATRAALADHQGEAIAEVETALIEADAWSAPSRAEQLLAGLGFKPTEWLQPVAHFSGGWRMRIALARTLMAPSELLLLDEPTNHLDLDAILWLEKWLSSYPGTVLLISHDTEFLDATAQSILHFSQGQLNRYRGGYQDFLTQRAERLRQTRLAWEKQSRETERLQGFIDRFKAKASKAKQAQSRVKALARMQILAPIYAESGISLHIPSPDHSPDLLLGLNAVSAGYVDDAGQVVKVLRNITLEVRAGSRIGMLGTNGAGKSTLIKTLANMLPIQAGERYAAPGLSIGYFAQHQLDMLDKDATPLIHLSRLTPQTREQALRAYLGSFGFSGDTVHRQIGLMSGGEKARLALSLIVWQKPNLLLLDEPSNHLDVETRTALAAALATFTGSVLLVSHDRHLLRTTVDSFWLIADGGVREFQGDLEDYRHEVETRRGREKKQASQPAPCQIDPLVDRKQQRRWKVEQRQRLATLRKPLETTLAQVEGDMAQVQKRLATLNPLIADTDFYAEARRQERQQILSDHGDLSKQLAELEAQWLMLQEKIEAIDQPI
jgi:ATP-binding cassette subfamily F protein 3